MNSFQLKMIAIITMLIDHTAAVLIPQSEPIHLYMRMIGRIAFPIFCYLIVEGFYHTRNVKKYILRLSAFALLSEIPFDLAIYKQVFYWNHQNIYFTLAIGLIVVSGVHWVSNQYSKNTILSKLLQVLVMLAGCVAATLLKTDYMFMGVVMIVIFYQFRGKKIELIFSVLVVTMFYGIGIELLATLSLILIFLHNGEKGPSGKYFFYVFYPAHLLILYLISYGFPR